MSKFLSIAIAMCFLLISSTNLLGESVVFTGNLSQIDNSDDIFGTDSLGLDGASFTWTLDFDNVVTASTFGNSAVATSSDLVIDGNSAVFQSGTPSISFGLFGATSALITSAPGGQLGSGSLFYEVGSSATQLEYFGFSLGTNNLASAPGASAPFTGLDLTSSVGQAFGSGVNFRYVNSDGIDIDFTSNNITVTNVAIPEPTSFCVFALSGLAILRRKR